VSLRRLPIPGWVLVASIVAFAGTWIVAPSSLLSGHRDARAGAGLPSRTSPSLAPVQALPAPPFRDRSHLPDAPVYSPGVEWKVAFTFDDGPHSYRTRRLLRILARHGVQATFFINGYWLDERYKKGSRNREVLRLIHRLGHAVGNHTLDHLKLSQLSEEEQTHQIVANHRLIEEVTGQAPTLFRPPYAVMTGHARRVVRRLGYAEARWNASAPDHELRDPELIRDTVMSWLRSYHGGIVMLHDRNRWSVEATRLILEALQRDNCRRLRRGKPTFQVVSLDSLLRPPPLSWALKNAAERDQHLQRLRRSCR
jgi:peptidoglycan/xylan/chitin deacetylase (PgdA/CDA1 family)